MWEEEGKERCEQWISHHCLATTERMFFHELGVQESLETQHTLKSSYFFYYLLILIASP